MKKGDGESANRPLGCSGWWPFIVLSTTVFLALVLPLVTTGGVLSPLSHFILVAAVLALGSIFLVFGGLESASAFWRNGCCS